LIGTLIGLVLLMRNLAGADLKSIAPGLGIAVLTTLYGAVLSNVVVLPLATKLQMHVGRRALVMQMIIEGTLLLQRREYPSRIERALRAYIGMPLGARPPTPSEAPAAPIDDAVQDGDWQRAGVVHQTSRAA
jgi:flagellar motor component MotA